MAALSCPGSLSSGKIFVTLKCRLQSASSSRNPLMEVSKADAAKQDASSGRSQENKTTQRVRFVEYKAKKILLLDFTKCELADVMVVVHEARRVIDGAHEQSLLTLTDVTGAHFNPATTRVMKEFSADNKRFVRAGAVVGLTPLTRTIYEAVLKFTGRNIPAFYNRMQALEWLAEQ